MTGRHRTPDVPMLSDQPPPEVSVLELLSLHPRVVTPAAVAVRTEDDRRAAWWEQQHSRVAAMADTVSIPAVAP